MTSPNRLLQAALNGDRDKAAHPTTPVSVKELERDASACVAAGARAIHMHPRDPEGRQTMEAGTVDGAVARVRRACGVPVGVTTSAEIGPDPERRLRLVGAWRAGLHLRQPLRARRAGTHGGLGEDGGGRRGGRVDGGGRRAACGFRAGREGHQDPG